MNFRRKTTRRVSLLLAGFVVVLIAGSAFIRVQLHRLEARRLAQREQGLTAYRQGANDPRLYAVAVDRLSRYLNAANTPDPEALHSLALAVTKTEGGSSADAIRYFRRYLELVPADDQARHELLDLYQHTDRVADAADLADDLLSRTSNDLSALHVKASALEAAGKTAAALETSQKINELDPSDLTWQSGTLYLMSRLKASPQSMVDRTDALIKQHPDDPRFELLRAYAADYAGDAVGLRHWLTMAATHPAPDSTFVQSQVAALRKLGYFAQARQVLEKSAGTDAGSLYQYVEALCQQNAFDVALEKLANVSAQNSKADSRLLGLKAFAMLNVASMAATRPTATLDSTSASIESATTIANTLAKRGGDDAAAGWSMLLRVLSAQPPASPREMVEHLSTAALHDPANAFIFDSLAKAYQAMGETDRAIQQWRRSSELALGWPGPHLSVAQVCLSRGDLEAAETEAYAAIERSASPLVLPEIILVQTSFPRLQARLAATQPAAASTQATEESWSILGRIALIQRALPDEPGTLPVQVWLLANRGRRDLAIATLRSVAEHQPSPQLLLRLARISSALDLGYEADLRQKVTTTESLISNPAAALDRALAMGQLGRSQQALRWLIRCRDKAGDSPAWQLVFAQFHDALNDLPTTTEWARLGDAMPNDLAMQRSILQSRSAWSDRSLIDRSINRLRALTGDSAINWRLARVRWQLQDVRSPQNSVVNAIAALTQITRDVPDADEPQLLWSQALLMQNDLAGAADHLRQAAIGKFDPPILLQLAHVLRLQGKISDAVVALNRIAAIPDLSDVPRLQAAVALGELNQPDAAISLLRADPVNIDIAGRLTLASLLQSRGDLAGAGSVMDALLAGPDADETVIVRAAIFFQQSDQAEKAKQTLSRLYTLTLPPGQLERARARFADATGDTAEAAKLLRSAIAASGPGSGIAVARAAWIDLLAINLRDGDFPTLLKNAPAAKAMVGKDADILALENAAEILLAVKIPLDTSLLRAALASSPREAAATQTIEAIKLSGQDPALLASYLLEFTGRNPLFLPAQLLAIQACALSDRADESISLATRAMTLFPASELPARKLTEMHTAAGRWRAAMESAAQWRSRRAMHPHEVDLVMAEIQRHLDTPAETTRPAQP